MILEALKPWLNMELYKAEQEKKNTPLIPSSTYLDALKKRGATDEDLADAKRISESMRKNVDANPTVANRLALVEGIEVGDEEGDPIVSLTPTQPHA